MPKLPRDPYLRKLEMFRQNFLFIISDGSYPPHRQQRLFQWCQKAGLDWEAARNYVAQDAIMLLKLVIGQVVADGSVSPAEVDGLHRLQRRLGLANMRIEPIERLYDIVEHKIEEILIERAAYLSSPGLIASVKQDIAAYQLPEERQQRLLQILARQHELATLMAGQLPVVQPQVELYPDEICHLDSIGTFEPEQAAAREVSSGRIVVTNLRLMFLSAKGGMTLQWSQIQAIVPLPNGVTILAMQLPYAQRGLAGHLKSGTVYCKDPQYIATLIGAARRLYTTPSPQPIQPNKRLLR